MIDQRTPRGLLVQVPENSAEDPSTRFPLDNTAGLARYYRQNGYAIVRGLIPATDCERIRGLWDREIKPSREFIYRQATAKAERHAFNSQGWVMNPILNLQSVDPRRYPGFRSFATDHILTAPGLTRAFRALLGEQPKIVQSMYFEGNSATWEHQDSYYLDSEHIGFMTAAWIALEDISASAGRFFVCPGSQNIDLGRQTSANNIADNHEVYIKSVVKKIEELNLPIRAPALEKGDVLFWNAWTIHGSLNSQDPRQARSSITCHAIPESHRFLQLQSRVMALDPARINGVGVHRPKDLARLRNRLVLHIETHYPEMFYRLKKAGIRMQVRLKTAHQG